jgi:hypothetical protein
MQGRRARRPLSWLVLSLLALLLPMAWGCDKLSGGSSARATGSGSAKEAEKTHEMEQKAAEIDRKSEEVRNMDGTEQEKIDAANSLDQERRETQESGNGQ